MVARKKGKFGAISQMNEVLVPFEYDSIKSIFNSHSLIAKKNGLWGVVSVEDGKIKTPFIYDNITPEYIIGVINFSDADYNRGSFSGLYSNHGFTREDVMALKSTRNGKNYMVSHVDGSILAKGVKYSNYVFKNRDKYGIIANGKLIVPASCSSVEELDNSKLSYKIDNRLGLVDVKKGNKIIPCKYSDIYSSDNDQFWIVEDKNEYLGVYDNQGKCIVPVKYDDVDDYSDEKLPHFIVEDENGLKGAYSTQGKLLLRVKYKNIRYDAENNKLVGEE